MVAVVDATVAGQVALPGTGFGLGLSPLRPLLPLRLALPLLSLLLPLCLLSVPMAGRAAPDALALSDDRGCLSCHGLVRKQVGPGFAQIAQRYRTDPDASMRLAEKVRRGSVGAWGRVIMPAQTRVTEAEATLLVAWILSQPAPPP